MILTVLVVYFFSITFYLIKVYYKDFQKEEVWWFFCIVMTLSPIMVFRQFWEWLKNCFFARYYRIKYIITYKSHPDTRLKCTEMIVRRFWFQDIINDDLIKLWKEKLKDDECFYISSITPSSHAEFTSCFEVYEN